MFRAAHRSSSGALNCICSLWFICPYADRPAGPTTNTARLLPRYEGKTRGCHCSHWAPDDGRENARNMLSCKQTAGWQTEKLLHQVGDLFELNVKLRCQKLEIIQSIELWNSLVELQRAMNNLCVMCNTCLRHRQCLVPSFIWIIKNLFLTTIHWIKGVDLDVWHIAIAYYRTTQHY